MRFESAPGVTFSGEHGFTLIEVIAVLVLTGVLAVFAGMGVVQMTKAFVFTKDATSLGQKNELVMTRMRRSVANLTNITPSASSLTIKRLNNGDEITELYSWSGTPGASLTLTITNSAGSSTPAREIADRVNSFALFFSKTDGSVWGAGDPVAELARVGINLTMATSGGDSAQFSDSVVPRNTYIPTDTGGAASGTTSGQGNPLCFVSILFFDHGTIPDTGTRFGHLLSTGRDSDQWFSQVVGPMDCHGNWRHRFHEGDNQEYKYDAGSK
ncbi:MAG: type II secretion system protein [Pseudomonadota bacterium]